MFMKDETKEILDVMTTMHEKVMAKLDILESDVGTLKSDVGTLKSDVDILKNGQMQLEANLAQTERTLFNEISSVHKDLSQRIDNHDGFTKEIDHVLGRVKIVEEHLEIEPA